VPPASAVIWGLHVSPDLDTVCYTWAASSTSRRAGASPRDLPRPRPDRAIRRAGVVQLATATSRPTSTAPPPPRGRTLTQITRAIARPRSPARCSPCDQPVRTRSSPRRLARVPGILRAREAQVEVRAWNYAGAAGRPPGAGRPGRAPRPTPSWSALEPDQRRSVRSWPCPDSSRRSRRRGPPLCGQPDRGGDAGVGPAGRLIRGRSSRLGDRRGARYGGWLDLLVFDEQDRALAPGDPVRPARPVVAPLMSSRDAEVALARARGRRARGRARRAMSVIAAVPVKDLVNASSGSCGPLAASGASWRRHARDVLGSARGGAPRLGGGDHHRRGGPGPHPRRGRRVLDRERQPGATPRRWPSRRSRPPRAASRASSPSRATCPGHRRRGGDPLWRARRGPASSSCRRGRASVPTRRSCPAGPMPLTFGEPSFANHLAAARAVGLSHACSSSPGSGSTSTHPTTSRSSSSVAPHAERATAAGLPSGAQRREPGSRARPLRGDRRSKACPRSDAAKSWPAIVEAARRQDTPIQDRDLWCEPEDRLQDRGRVVRLADVSVSDEGRTVADEIGRDPRLVAVILGESRRMSARPRTLLIVETHHGFVSRTRASTSRTWTPTPRVSCPRTPTARRARCAPASGRSPATSWRSSSRTPSGGRGARGSSRRGRLAGIQPIVSYLAQEDPAGHVLPGHHPGLADEAGRSRRAGMGKLDRVPWPSSAARLAARRRSSRALLRDPARDLFR